MCIEHSAGNQVVFESENRVYTYESSWNLSQVEN